MDDGMTTNDEDPKYCEHCGRRSDERLCFWCATIEKAIAELLGEAE